MVGPGLSAAAEERQRKLQEYLAAKGKLKCQNTKPYLRAKNNCPNPPPSKSTIKPKKDLTNHSALSVKATRPVNTKYQPRLASNTVSQKPKLEPQKLLGKKPALECVSSNPNCKPSSNSQQHHGAGSSLSRELSRKTMGSLNITEFKTIKQQEPDQENAKFTEFVDHTLVETKSLDNFPKEMIKENLPQTLSDSERKSNPDLQTLSNSYNLAKNNLAPKQILNSAILKDRVNKQFVGETQIGVPPINLQQLSRGANLARPREKFSKTVPSHFVQTVSRTQASKKPVVKYIKNIKVSKGKYEGTNETKLISHTVTEQKVKHTKPRAYPSLLREGYNNRHPNIKQNQKSTQPCFKSQASCVLQKAKTMSQKPNLTADFKSVIPCTPCVRASRANGDQYNNSARQKAQTLDSKLKKTLPQNNFLNKTASKTQAGDTTINQRRIPNGIQTNTNIKKKTTADDRRKQLEEWQKSKRKIYKRPPMELKKKRKIIEEMNISFWKSMENEEEEKKAQLELSDKINNTLTECLHLIERGELSNEIFTILSSIPEAEKFAKFWICKAKLLASKGSFDVIGMYKEAIKNGATPIQELREFVLNVLQDPERTIGGTTSDSLVAENNIEELAKKIESGKSYLFHKESEEVTATPQRTKEEQDNHTGIKLQIAHIPRIHGMPEMQDMKLITPVRRSARIERAVSRYPEMLQEHDLVVASLNELLEVEEAECFMFRKNEALPITLEFQNILES